MRPGVRPPGTGADHNRAAGPCCSWIGCQAVLQPRGKRTSREGAPDLRPLPAQGPLAGLGQRASPFSLCAPGSGDSALPPPHAVTDPKAKLAPPSRACFPVCHPYPGRLAPRFLFTVPSSGCRGRCRGRAGSSASSCSAQEESSPIPHSALFMKSPVPSVLAAMRVGCVACLLPLPLGFSPTDCFPQPRAGGHAGVDMLG